MAATAAAVLQKTSDARQRPTMQQKREREEQHNERGGAERKREFACTHTRGERAMRWVTREGDGTYDRRKKKVKPKLFQRRRKVR